MEIYTENLFKKYIGNPVRIKYMGTEIVAIVEGSVLLASFDNIEELRKYFPYGNYIKL